MPLLAVDAPAHEEEHQHGDERDRDDGGHRHRVGLRERERAEETPFLLLEREHRHEGDGDDEQGEEQRRADLLRRAQDDLEVGALSSPLFVVFVGVLDHDDRRVDEHADRDRDAAERHDVRAEALPVHHDEREQERDGDREDRHERRAHVEEEEDTHESDDDRLFEQRAREGGHGALDQRRAVVADFDGHVVWQPCLELREPRLDPLDRLERIGAGAHDDDAAYGLALAVPLREPAPDLRADRDVGDLTQEDRSATGAEPEHDSLEILDAAYVAAPAHHQLGLAALDHASADIGVRALDGPLDRLQRDAVGPHLQRVDLHLILADETADRRDLCDAFDGGERIAQVVVLQAAELGQGALLGAERVHVGPADPCRVGTELGHDAGGELRGEPGERLEDTGASPVQVRPVLEEHVDERDPEVGVAPHDLRVRDREHLRRDRCRDLVLDHLGSLARVLRVHDDLDVRQVRDGVEAHLAKSPGAPEHRERECDHHQKLVAHRPFDQLAEHRRPPQ